MKEIISLLKERKGELKKRIESAENREEENEARIRFQEAGFIKEKFEEEKT